MYYGKTRRLKTIFCDVTLACEDRQIGAHKVNINCNSRQDEFVRNEKKVLFVKIEDRWLIDDTYKIID